MTPFAPRHILLSVCILVVATAQGIAQEPQTAPRTGAHSSATPAAEPQEPKTSGQATTQPHPSEQSGWPEPVTDRETFGYLLFDNTEFQRAGGAPDAFRWDTFGWRGGDVHRFWFKSEGRVATQTTEGSEFEAQALYGKLI